MFTKEYLDKMCKDFFEEYKEATPGYSSYSRSLKKSIPGKTQLRTAFIENLGELLVLCDDEEVCNRIKLNQKKYK